MALTISDVAVSLSGGPRHLGNIFAREKVITFDTAYPSGGYSIAASKLGFPSRIIGAALLGFAGVPGAGVGSLAWDYTNNKLLVLGDGSAPPLIVDEVVAITSHAGQLARVPAYIIAAEASAGGTTGPLRIIPTGETPATTQMAVTLTTGAVVCATADAVTAVKVSYIPLGVGPFIEANRVIDESNTGANDTTRQLANRAALVQYFWNDTAGTLPTFVPVGEAPGSGEVACDINSSGDTVFTVNAAQDDATYKITYWKFSALNPGFGWTDDGDTTISSTSLFAIADDIAVPPQGIWIPALGNVLVGEATATNIQIVLVGPSGTAGALIGVYDPIKGTIALTAGDAITTFAMAYMFLNGAQVQPAQREVPAGQNLSSLAARVLFFGV